MLHTIDGLLMCMIGLNFIISEKKYAFVGFFFIGFAALCKQNYLVILPFTLFLFGRRKIVSNTIIGFLPIALYISIISYFGGFEVLLELPYQTRIIPVEENQAGAKLQGMKTA